MHIGRLTRAIGYSLLVMLMVTGSAVPGRAQGHDDHGGPGPQGPQKLTPQQNDLVKAVRDATARFKNVTDPSEVGDPYGCCSDASAAATSVPWGSTS